MIGTAVMAILAGVSLIAMVVVPMGKAPLRENDISGWAAWRKEFTFCLKFYNPLVVFYEWGMGWNRLDETVVRLLFGIGGAFILLAGFALVALGIYVAPM